MESIDDHVNTDDFYVGISNHGALRYRRSWIRSGDVFGISGFGNAKYCGLRDYFWFKYLALSHCRNVYGHRHPSGTERNSNGDSASSKLATCYYIHADDV